VIFSCWGLDLVIVEEDVAAWAAGLDELFAGIAARICRVEPRRRARAYVRGVLAPLAGLPAGVFLTYATAKGRTLIDRELLPGEVLDSVGSAAGRRSATRSSSPPRRCWPKPCWTVR
jgi:hypothetical protein